jgi:glutathione S-transferase
MTSQKPEITLYFLQASRSIRIAWFLEELSLPYKSIFFPRENNKAPSAFKSDSGNKLGKAPCLKDGGLTIGESYAMNYVLCMERR